MQTILGVVDGGLRAQEAVDAPRIHVEGDLVEAEPGTDEEALDRLRASEWRTRPFRERNLYFGGVQAAERDAEGAFSGGGDPRRGGVATVVD